MSIYIYIYRGKEEERERERRREGQVRLSINRPLENPPAVFKHVHLARPHGR